MRSTRLQNALDVRNSPHPEPTRRRPAGWIEGRQVDPDQVPDFITGSSARAVRVGAGV